MSVHSEVNPGASHRVIITRSSLKPAKLTAELISPLSGSIIIRCICVILKIVRAIVPIWVISSSIFSYEDEVFLYGMVLQWVAKPFSIAILHNFYEIISQEPKELCILKFFGIKHLFQWLSCQFICCYSILSIKVHIMYSLRTPRSTSFCWILNLFIKLSEIQNRVDYCRRSQCSNR